MGSEMNTLTHCFFRTSRFSDIVGHRIGDKTIGTVRKSHDPVETVILGPFPDHL